MMRDEKGRFIKGIHANVSTEFKNGEHRSRKTEFKKGISPYNKNIQLYSSPEKVIELYKQGYSTVEISKILKGDRKACAQILKENNIQIKKQRKVLPTKRKEWIHEKEIVDLYDKDNNIYQISNLLELSPSFVNKVLIKNNIPRKGTAYFCKGEKHPFFGRIGEEAANWQGGLSFLPYPKEFNKKFKEAIKIRDGFLCLKCGMRNEDACLLFKKGLGCHHIDYVKENTIPENCCSLCIRCNGEVNVNRQHWTKFFQSMLAERYGYKYSEDGEVIINLGELKNE